MNFNNNFHSVSFKWLYIHINTEKIAEKVHRDINSGVKLITRTGIQRLLTMDELMGNPVITVRGPFSKTVGLRHVAPKLSAYLDEVTRQPVNLVDGTDYTLLGSSPFDGSASLNDLHIRGNTGVTKYYNAVIQLKASIPNDAEFRKDLEKFLGDTPLGKNEVMPVVLATQDNSLWLLEHSSNTDKGFTPVKYINTLTNSIFDIILLGNEVKENK